MPSFGRKRLGLASTARQAGEGHTSIDSTVSVRALPGGFNFWEGPEGEQEKTQEGAE